MKPPPKDLSQTNTGHIRTPWRNDPNVSLDELQARNECARQQELRAHEIQEHSARTRAGLHAFHKANFSHWLDGPDPNQAQISIFYKSIATTLLRCDIPIVLFQNLTITSSTLPADHLLDDMTPTTVSQTIFQKISDSIPSECQTLRDILLTYNRTQDGYAALFSIMRHGCSFLKTLRPTWGPQWPPDYTAYKYKSLLDTWLDDQSRHNQAYTEYEQAAEMLQHACTIDRYKLVATTYLTRLQIQGPGHPIGRTFALDELTNLLEDNHTGPNPNAIAENPTINKFQGSNGDTKGNNNTNNRRRFTYRREVQCDCCHTFGHNVDEDICRIGAQVYYTMQFIKEHPKKADNNAKAFTTANNKAKIAAVEAAFPGFFEDAANQDDIEQRITTFATLISYTDNQSVTHTPPEPIKESE